MSAARTRVEVSDQDLLETARGGDADAFDRLWARHRLSAERLARQFAGPGEVAALTARSRAVIAERVGAGGGPAGAFRPYLYSTIRSLSPAGGAAVSDPSDDDPSRGVTARAYRRLPQRWQTLLWYAEVERMTPELIAPLVGMRAGEVAVATQRARDALRSAWLDIHAADSSLSVECRWTLARVRDADTVAARRDARLAAHLGRCSRCARLVAESERVHASLAQAVLPVVVGGIAAGALISQLSTGAALAAQGAASAASVAVAGTAGTVGAVGAAAGTSTGVGVGASGVAVGMAAAVAITGSLAVGPSSAVPPENPATTTTTAVDAVAVTPVAAVSAPGTSSTRLVSSRGGAARPGSAPITTATPIALPSPAPAVRPGTIALLPDHGVGADHGPDQKGPKGPKASKGPKKSPDLPAAATSGTAPVAPGSATSPATPTAPAPAAPAPAAPAPAAPAPAPAAPAPAPVKAAPARPPAASNGPSRPGPAAPGKNSGGGRGPSGPGRGPGPHR